MVTRRSKRFAWLHRWSLVCAGSTLLTAIAEAAPPTDIDLSGMTIAESTQEQTLIGVLTVVDPDVTDFHEFLLESGEGDTHNDWFSIEEDELVLDDPLDFEQLGGVIEIRIEVTDSTDESFSKRFVLSLSDDRTEDTDRDGLTEAEEEDLHGTSDLSFDTDLDGIADPIELEDSTSPTDPMEFSDHGLIGWGDNRLGVLLPAYDDTFLSLSAAESHAAAPRFDGSVILWAGDDTFGQTSPPPALGPVVMIAAGGDPWLTDGGHSVALLADGTVSAWGYDEYGQASPPAPLDGVIEVACGRGHSLALKDNGTVVAWGHNRRGQTDVPADLDQVIAIAAGGHQSLALRSDGSVVGWGEWFDGTRWQPFTPPAGLRDVVAIDAGYHHALALRHDGSVVAWGNDQHGQSSVPAEAVAIAGVSCGGFHNLARSMTGEVIAWGSNDEGQTVIPPTAATDVVAIEAGLNTSLALRQAGTHPEVISAPEILTSPGQAVTHPISIMAAVPSGFQAFGLPSGLSIDPSSGVITGTLTGPARASVRVFIDTDKGRLQQTLWVGSLDGSAPTDLTLDANQVTENDPADTLVGSLSATDADPGDTFTFELVDGPGDTFNPHFQISGQTLSTRGPLELDFESFTPPLGIRVRVTDGSLNAYETVLTLSLLDDRGEDADQDGLTEAQEEDLHGTSDLLFDTDGDGYSDPLEVSLSSLPDDALSIPAGSLLFGSGSDDAGQASPPSGLVDVVGVAAGGGHSLARLGDGKVVAWGSNSDGQSSVPPTLADVVRIDAGNDHSLALHADGSLSAWGSNSHDQTTLPTGLGDVIDIACGAHHNLALRHDGSVAAWGRNAEEQCDLPAALGAVVGIAAGADFSAALLEDGTIVSWGLGAAGDFGIPSSLNEEVIGIAAGDHHGLALKADGSVFGWGDNQQGQVTIPHDLEEVIAIAAGGRFSVAVTRDGSVFVWGESLGPPSPDLNDVARLAAGGAHLVALKRETPLPEILPESRVESSPGSLVVGQVVVAHALATHHTAIGLPSDLSLDPETGAIEGTIVTGEVRAVRLMVETDRGPTARILLFNTRDGSPPTDVDLESAPILENSPAGTVVGTLTTEDIDPLDAHTYELTTGPASQNNAFFEIVGDELRVAVGADLNYEVQNGILYIRIRSTDAGGFTVEESFEVHLLDDWSEDEDGDGYNQSEDYFQSWAAGLGLTGYDALPNATPFPDGVPNLMRYASPVDPALLPDPLPQSLFYEAEDATYVGPLFQADDEGYSGLGFIDFTNDTSDYVEWRIHSPVSGHREVRIRYAQGPDTLANRPLELRVNDQIIDPTLDFAQTGESWDSWTDKVLTLPLDLGENRIRLTAVGWSGANFDRLELPVADVFAPFGPSSSRPVLETVTDGSGDLIRFKYFRRRNTGLIFEPLIGDRPVVTEMLPLDGETSVTPVDDLWELAVEERFCPADPAGFLQLQIDFP